MNRGFNPDDWLRQTPKSIEGLGVPNQRYMEHSPVPLTSRNITRILFEVGAMVQWPELVALRTLAFSAIESHDRYQEKTEEAGREEADQRSRWEQYVAKPLEAEFQALEQEYQKLHGIEITARANAAAIAARKGMRFVASDFDSVEAFQEAINDSYRDAEEIRGDSQSASLSASVPIWLEGVSAISPVCLCLITALGLQKLLFGTSAFESPMFIVACALALGITIPVLIWSYRLGWLLATTRENDATAVRTTRSTSALIFWAIMLFAVTAFLAGIDMMAILALAKESAQSNARVGASVEVPWWLPWLGCGFTWSAVAAKAWAGYGDSLQEFQEDQVSAIQREQVDQVRAAVSDAIILIATADIAAARLAEVQERREELSAQIGELQFTAEFSEELIAETAVERNAWIGESNRFWTMVWTSSPWSTASASRQSSWDRRLTSIWDTFFRGRR